MTDTSRGTLVRMGLELLADLTTTPPCLVVPWPDFPLWTAHLAARDVTCKLRIDGRVDVTVCEDVDGWGFLVVTAVVDVVQGMELPPVESRRPARLPVSELDRCELFVKAVA